MAVALKCRELHTLEISGRAGVTGEFLKCCPRDVKRLNLDRCSDITARSLEEFATIGDRSQLIDLNLSGNGNVTDGSMASIARGSENLRVLYVSGCAGVTDEGVEAIASTCKELQILELSGCAVTDVAADTLACYLPGLIKLSCSDGFTDVGLRALARGCKMLRVPIIYNTLVTPPTVRVFSAANPLFATNTQPVVFPLAPAKMGEPAAGGGAAA
jgi:hypothetical protein